MNKFLVFPLFFLLALSLYSIADATGSFSGEPGESPELPDDVTVDIPEADTQEFDIWGGTYAIAVIVAAIAVGVLAGIRIFDTGLSDQAQKLLFNSILFLSLWACLSAVAYDYLFQNAYTIMLWILITTIYTIGLGLHMTGADE